MVRGELGFACNSANSFDLDLALLRSEFEYCESTYATGSVYDNVAMLRQRDLRRRPVLRELTERISNAFDISSRRGFGFDNLWAVRSTADDTDPSWLPYVPHIDNRRLLKVMIYLDDVGIHDGPFHGACCRPDDFEPKRLSFSSEFNTRGENRITSIPEECFEACLGPAGTTVVFDTNCPHYAGQVSPGALRRVLRFSFFNRSWRTPNQEGPWARQAASRVLSRLRPTRR